MNLTVTFQTVHTIDARGNVMLEVVKGYFALSDAQVRRFIQQVVVETVSILAAKGIRYEHLKPALVPQVDRVEVALFFDREQIESGWYGPPVHQRIIRLLERRSSHSVRHGDLLGSPQQQSWIKTAVEIHLIPSGNPFRLQDSHQLYCVYVNNLSAAMAKRLHDGLQPYPPYVGYADMTFTSQFKVYVSQFLAAGYIKHKHIVIQRHPDDLPHTTDENTLGYPFEEAGLLCRSVPDSHFSLLLSYKLERPVLPGFESDNVFALAAVSDSPVNLSALDFEIEQRKFEYLVSKKTGTLKRLGVLSAPKVRLEDLVTAKLASNYIYSMAFSEEMKLSKFNMMLELEALDTGESVRVLGAFEYDEPRRRLRLITLF